MDALKSALKNQNSVIYNSTNLQTIKKYVKKNGIAVTDNEIKRIIDISRFGDVKYKNKGSQRIAETGKEFVQRFRFMSNLQSDSAVLSKSRKYGTASRYILVVLCQLSRILFLRSCHSLKFEVQKRAWESIFKEMLLIYPKAKVSSIIHDGGSEVSFWLKKWFKEKQIKSYTVRRRLFRLSKGASSVESAIRRMRNNLEKVMLMEKSGKTFVEKLKLVQDMCNNQILNSIGMSPLEALTQDPAFIAMYSRSKKLKQRKYLIDEMVNGGEKTLKKYDIVKIIKNQSKEFASTRKESYGFLSPCFIIIDIVNDRDLKRYRLGNLFTFVTLPGTYGLAELKLCNYDYVTACSIEERNVVKFIKVTGDLLIYKVASCERDFIALKSLKNDVTV